jgi:hypothetical protein
MLLILLAVLLLGVVAALSTARFTPDPSLGAVRRMVAAMVLAAGGLLVVSLRYEWWIMHDWESEYTEVGRGDSPLALAIVAAGLTSCVTTVSAAWGGRNWAFLPLSVTWFLVAWGWVIETGNGDAGGEALFGLELAGWAMLVVTLAAALGSINRLVERRTRRARAESDIEASPDAQPSRSPLGPATTLSGRDVIVALAIVGLVFGKMLGVVPAPTWAPIALGSLAAAIRVRHLLATGRASPPPSR